MDLTDREIRAVFAYFDQDGSGTITYDEFIVGVRVSRLASICAPIIPPHAQCNLSKIFLIAEYVYLGRSE